MSNDKDVEVKIGGSSAEVEAAMKRAGAAVQESMGNISKIFSDVKAKLAGGLNVSLHGVEQAKAGLAGLETGASAVASALGKVKGLMASVAVALAGGKAFSAGVEETKQFTAEANKLARVLGIDATSASTLNVALGDVYSSADDFVDASTHLGRQVLNNEEGLNKMGLATRDSSGEYRNMQDIMMDAIKVLNGYKDGTDRNLAAQEMFGRGAANLNGILKLTPERLEETKQKQKELGLIVGKENVEANAAYKASMNDVGDVMTAIKKAIGDAVMPVLTRLGEWFAVIGPAAVTVVKGAVGGLIAVFWGLKNSITIVWELINAFVVSIAEPIRAAGEVMYKALTGDFHGAANAVREIPKTITKAWSSAFDEIVAGSIDTQEKLKNLFDNPTPTDAKDTTKGNSFSNPKKKGNGEDKKDKGKEETRVAGWERDLAKDKEAYAQKQAIAGTFHEYSLQEEINYWNKLRSRKDLSEKEKNAVDKKYYEALSTLRKKNFEGHIASLKTELDSYQNNQDERLRIANQMAEEIGQKYGLESKEYEAAQQQIIQIARQKQQQIRQIEEAMNAATMAERQAAVDQAEVLAQIEVELGRKTNAEMLADERRFEAERYAIALDGINQRKAAIEAQGVDRDVVGYQQVLNEKAALDQQYALKKRNLDLKSTQDSMKYWKGFQSSMESVYTNGMNQILARTLSFKDALRGLFREILRNFIQEMVTKRLAAWASAQTKELAMAAATKAQQLLIGQTLVTQETSMKEQGATEQATAVASGAMGEVTAKGASAGAGAASSQAGIPFVGPALAVAAMAAIMASVFALKGKIKSASGGYSIPRGLNPLTQLHEEEMVLPKAESSVIRDLAMGKLGGRSAGGDGGGNTGGGQTIHLNINAVDSHSVKKLLTNNKSAVSEALKKQMRNFAT